MPRPAEPVAVDCTAGRVDVENRRSRVLSPIGRFFAIMLGHSDSTVSEYSRTLSFREVARNIDIFYEEIKPYLALVADDRDLRTYFSEFITNALDAIIIKDNLDTGEIAVTVQRKAEALVITISDNGCGINERFLTELSAPGQFSSRKGQLVDYGIFLHGSVGLGILLIEEIFVDRLGGKVSFDTCCENGQNTGVLEIASGKREFRNSQGSRTTQGTTATVELPLRKPRGQVDTFVLERTAIVPFIPIFNPDVSNKYALLISSIMFGGVVIYKIIKYWKKYRARKDILEDIQAGRRLAISDTMAFSLTYPFVIDKAGKLFVNSIEVSNTNDLVDEIVKEVSRAGEIFDRIVKNVDGRYEYIVRELVTNAYDAIRRTYLASDKNVDIEGEISVNLEYQENTIRIEISDNGCGIDKDKLESWTGNIDKLRAQSVSERETEDAVAKNEQLGLLGAGRLGLIGVYQFLKDSRGMIIFDTLCPGQEKANKLARYYGLLDSETVKLVQGRRATQGTTVTVELPLRKPRGEMQPFQHIIAKHFGAAIGIGGVVLGGAFVGLSLIFSAPALLLSAFGFTVAGILSAYRLVGLSHRVEQALLTAKQGQVTGSFLEQANQARLAEAKMQAKVSDGEINLMNVIGPKLLQAFSDTRINPSGKINFVYSSTEDYGRQLFATLEGIPDEEFVVLALHNRGNGRDVYTVIVDKVAHLKNTERFLSVVTGNVRLNEFQFILKFKIFSSQRLVQLDLGSIGQRQSTNFLESQGISSEAFGKLVLELEKHCSGMRVVAVALEEHERKNFKVIPHLMKKHFDLLVDGPITDQSLIDEIHALIYVDPPDQKFIYVGQVRDQKGPGIKAEIEAYLAQHGITHITVEDTQYANNIMFVQGNTLHANLSALSQLSLSDRKELYSHEINHAIGMESERLSQLAQASIMPSLTGPILLLEQYLLNFTIYISELILRRTVRLLCREIDRVFTLSITHDKKLNELKRLLDNFEKEFSADNIVFVGRFPRTLDALNSILKKHNYIVLPDKETSKIIICKINSVLDVGTSQGTVEVYSVDIVNREAAPNGIKKLAGISYHYNDDVIVFDDGYYDNTTEGVARKKFVIYHEVEHEVRRRILEKRGKLPLIINHIELNEALANLRAELEADDSAAIKKLYRDKEEEWFKTYGIADEPSLAEEHFRIEDNSLFLEHQMSAPEFTAGLKQKIIDRLNSPGLANTSAQDRAKAVVGILTADEHYSESFDQLIAALNEIGAGSRTDLDGLHMAGDYREVLGVVIRLAIEYRRKLQQARLERIPGSIIAHAEGNMRITRKEIPKEEILIFEDVVEVRFDSDQRLYIGGDVYKDYIFGDEGEIVTFDGDSVGENFIDKYFKINVLKEKLTMFSNNQRNDIEKIVRELIANAYDASREVNLKLKKKTSSIIKVKLYIRGKDLIIEVSDDGCGIELDDLFLLAENLDNIAEMHRLGWLGHGKRGRLDDGLMGRRGLGFLFFIQTKVLRDYNGAIIIDSSCIDGSPSNKLEKVGERNSNIDILLGNRLTRGTTIELVIPLERLAVSTLPGFEMAGREFRVVREFIFQGKEIPLFDGANEQEIVAALNGELDENVGLRSVIVSNEATQANLNLALDQTGLGKKISTVVYHGQLIAVNSEVAREVAENGGIDLTTLSF
ncbi:MAG: ATP-binding protein [Candidatus Omnitrophota bacterium]